jgi:hypothetical protein
LDLIKTNNSEYLNQPLLSWGLFNWIKIDDLNRNSSLKWKKLQEPELYKILNFKSHILDSLIR